MPNSPPPRSPPPPPAIPVVECTVGVEGEMSRPLSPSLRQIPLPFWSLTRNCPSMPPAGEQHRPTAASPSSSRVEGFTSLLPTRRTETSPLSSQHPPWLPRPRASPLRRPLWVTGSRRHILSHSESVPDNNMELQPPDLESGRLNPDPAVTMPSTSATKKKREASSQLQPSELQSPLTKPYIGREEEDEEGQSDSDNSTYSSPIHEPRPPIVPIWRNSTGKVYYGLTSDRAALDTYDQAYRKYMEKQARQDRLATLKPSLAVSCIMESYGPKEKEILLNVSRSVLSISAYIDDKEINRCTGIVIEWDEEKRFGTILTSAWLICTMKPFDDWLDKNYASNAKVLVHLLDGSTVNGKLLYFSKHYDLAFYEVSGDMHLKSLPLEPDLEYGQSLSLLARDKNMDLICTAVNVNYLDPCEHQHNHYLFINHSIRKCGSGGALAGLNGSVVGMLFCTLPLTAFIPSSLILRCSDLLRKFGRLARPQLGLKLRTVGFLDISSIESLSRSCGITSGLIVGEVSAECVAERNGIRAGDVILSLQGESISSVTQWEEILLGIGKEHLEKGSDMGLKVDVKVDVFHVRKRRHRRRLVSLSVELSDDNEIFC